jgi:hypothetical protein
MKALQLVLILLIVTVSAWSLLAADQVGPPVPIRASGAQEDAGKAARPSAKLTPMMEEIQAAVQTTREAVADLADRFRAATDETEALELARAIRCVKLDGRIEVLRIQLRYARQDGRDETVAKLEAAIERMTVPPRSGQPIPRPAPEQPAGQ